jgi:hypothetical protein
MCPKFLAGLQPRQGGCLSLPGYLHLESAPAPQNPGPEVDAQDVDRPGLGGDRPVRVSRLRVRRGHGLPAVDVRGTQVNDVPVALRPGQNPATRAAVVATTREPQHFVQLTATARVSCCGFILVMESTRRCRSVPHVAHHGQPAGGC